MQLTPGLQYLIEMARLDRDREIGSGPRDRIGIAISDQRLEIGSGMRSLVDIVSLEHSRDL